MDERVDGQHSEFGDEACKLAEELDRVNRELSRLRELEAGRDQFVSELGEQIEVLQRQHDEIDSQYRETRDAKEAAERELASLRARLDALYSSETWRAGKAALWLPKRVQQVINRKRGRGESSA